MTFVTPFPTEPRRAGLAPVSRFRNLFRALLRPSARLDRIAAQDLADSPRGSIRPPLSSQDAATRLAIRAGMRSGNW